jgi:signal transduction histidine kinase
VSARDVARGSGPLLLVAASGAAIALGVAAESVSFGWGDADHAVPDAVTGWTLIAAGLVAWRAAPGLGAGPLLVLTGVTWFAGNFWASAAFLHRGPLVHLLLAFPAPWPASRLARAGIVSGYGTAMVPAVWRSDAATIVLAGLLVAIAVADRGGAVGPLRRARGPALAATVAVGAVLAGGAVLRLAVPEGDADDPALLAYEVVLCAVAVGLSWAASARAWERAPLADLVVELSGTPSGPVRDALARALGDPTLAVGYRVRGGYVDADGRPLALPSPGDGRAATLVDGEDGPVAALVHDEAVLADPRLVEAVREAARMGAANAELQLRVREQIAELEASGRRLIAAADDERRRLEATLREGALRRLEELDAMLAVAAPGRARELLARARADLDDVARGLHPRVLAEKGLAGAVAALAEAAPVEVELELDASPARPSAAEAAAYFVCAEALANATKHAGATRVRISLARRGDRLALLVEDDGAGGADPARGSGLRGLADRVEALGGTLEIESPAGRGTRVAADIPAGGDEG